MKNSLIFISILIAVLVLPSCNHVSKQTPTRIESRMGTIDAPNFSLKNLKGERVALSSFEGKSPVFIKFWATWCGYCKKEIPKIVKLRRQYSSKDLTILSIDIQESSGKVSNFAKKMGINYSVLLDQDASVATQYGVSSVPTMFLIDKEGHVVAKSHSLTSQFLELIEHTTSS